MEPLLVMSTFLWVDLHGIHTNMRKTGTNILSIVKNYLVSEYSTFTRKSNYGDANLQLVIK